MNFPVDLTICCLSITVKAWQKTQLAAGNDYYGQPVGGAAAAAAAAGGASAGGASAAA